VKPLVVLAGPIHPDGLAQLEAEARVLVVDEARLTEAELGQAARDAEGILFRTRPRCTRDLMAACPRLRVVGRHGAGLDIVDLDAATELGVAVVHAPGSNADAVAEHAILLMLACAKKLPENEQLLRRGQWPKGAWQGSRELRGRTLGIVGVGNIGRRVARLGLALGMRVLGYDKYVAPEEVRARGAEPLPDLDSLLAQADVITCHTPLTPETRHMIDARAISRMKDGVIFINTSRGPVQDEGALFEALTRGRIWAAGLDVWEEEPVNPDNPLLNLPNVVPTSHVAGVTDETRRGMAMQVTAEMLRVLRGERPHVLGNPALWPRLGHLR
jgi:D-3-phosphoglycerate dehydrogenase